MSAVNDDELRAMYEQLRAGDDTQLPAPSFRALWARAESSAKSPPRSRVPVLRAALWIAAAACLVVTASVAFRQTRTTTNTAVSPAVRTGATSLSDWTSPTAGLLRTSDTELLAPAPILASILDGVTRVRLQPKGD
jgi:hypothetical protein